MIPPVPACTLQQQQLIQFQTIQEENNKQKKNWTSLHDYGLVGDQLVCVLMELRRLVVVAIVVVFFESLLCFSPFTAASLMIMASSPPSNLVVCC